MLTQELIETEDKSYYADWLEYATGKPRTRWGLLPIDILKKACARLRRRMVFREKRKAKA